MADVKINISTAAQLEGLKQTRNELDQLQGKLSALAATGGIHGNLSAIGAVVAAVTVAFQAASKAVTEYSEHEQDIENLNNTLVQTGNYAANSAQAYAELADELQAATNIASGEWLKTINKLFQFGSTQKSLGIDIETVRALAGLMGGNLAAATEQYARALQGNYVGLARLGVKIDENATKEEALAQIRKRAEVGAGAIDARNLTLAGTYTKLKNSVNDTYQSFGKLIAATGVLQGLSLGAAKSFDGLTFALEKVHSLLKQLAPSSVNTEMLRYMRSLAIATEDTAKATQTHSEAQTTAKIKVKDHNDALRAQINLLDDLQREADNRADASTRTALANLRVRRAAAPDDPQTRAQFDLEEARIRSDAETSKLQRAITFGERRESEIQAQAIREGRLTPERAAELRTVTGPLQAAREQLGAVGAERAASTAEINARLARENATAMEAAQREARSAIKASLKATADTVDEASKTLNAALERLAASVTVQSQRLGNQRN